jgi:DNA polymerase-3 subunit delta'
MIFAGPAGVGKATTAAALAAVLLCDAPRGDEACGSCPSCVAMQAQSHPDYHRIYKELIRLAYKERKAIELGIEVVRQYLVEPAARTAVRGRGKIFVIEQAELMSTAAQNATLKTLEEPSGQTCIILLTDQPGLLLPTIRSRCQTVQFAPLDEAMVKQELAKRGIDAAAAADAAAMSEGSLGRALQWAQDDVVAAGRELAERLDQLTASGAAGDLGEWLRRRADEYAERQLKRDPLGSKDQGLREGLAVYLRMAAGHFRGVLRQSGAAATQQRACAAIDAVARAEQNLDANVSVALSLQQLAVALEATWRPH